MTKSPSLDLLIDVTHEAVDNAAKQVQQAALARSKAQEQLETLHAYRLDYAQRLQESGRGGLTASNYLNFLFFLNTLDEAISQHNNIFAQTVSRLAAGPQQLLAERQKRVAVDALQTLQLQQQGMRED